MIEFYEKTPLDEAFVYWYDLVKKASASYNAEEIEVDGSKRVSSTIKFNFSVPSEYEYLLQDYYERFQHALETDLSNAYFKSEKLRLLTRYQAELDDVVKLLTKDAAAKWRHQRFEFWNQSEQPQFRHVQITEDDFQRSYSAMASSLTKMQSFLKITKENILAIPQAEIPVPPGMLPDPNASGKDKPLEFFEWFFKRSGLTVLHKRFEKRAEENGDYFSENEDAWLFQIALDENHEDIKIERRYFEDELKSILVQQIYISTSFIPEYVEAEKTPAAITMRIRLLLSSLDYYHQQTKERPHKRYTSCSDAVSELQKYIQGKYARFCPQDFQPAVSKQNALVAPVRSFLIRGNIPAIANKLWNGLLREALIERETKESQLLKAFDGSLIQEPLNIRWLSVGQNNVVNKVSLFLLLNRLAKEGIIMQQESKELYCERVRRIFCDQDGNPLENLSNSHYEGEKTYKRSPGYVEQISGIVTELKQLLD